MESVWGWWFCCSEPEVGFREVMVGMVMCWVKSDGMNERRKKRNTSLPIRHLMQMKKMPSQNFSFISLQTLISPIERQLRCSMVKIRNRKGHAWCLFWLTRLKNKRTKRILFRPGFPFHDERQALLGEQVSRSHITEPGVSIPIALVESHSPC